MGVKKVVIGQDERVAQWVGERIGEEGFGPCVALGLEEDDKLIAGVVFNMYTGAALCMHVAAVPGRRWMTREFLFEVFGHAFVTCKCNRVTGLVREDNLDAQRFDEHLGFVREGLLREGAKDRTNMIVYGMLKKEAQKWLDIRLNKK